MVRGWKTQIRKRAKNGLMFEDLNIHRLFIMQSERKKRQETVRGCKSGRRVRLKKKKKR